MNNHSENSALNNNHRLAAALAHSVKTPARTCARCSVELVARLGRPRLNCQDCSKYLNQKRSRDYQRSRSPERKAETLRLERERYRNDPKFRARCIRKVRAAQHARPLTLKAQAMVGRLVRAGKLTDPRTLLCVDCGGKAREYEHRNYFEPLDVVPVCHPCNIKRGPGYPYDQPNFASSPINGTNSPTAIETSGPRHRDPVKPVIRSETKPYA